MEDTYRISILSQRPQLLDAPLAQNYQLQQFPIKEQFLQHITGSKLIVLDLLEEDGAALGIIKDIKNMEQCESVPILVLHGSKMHETRLQAFEMGCDDYIDAHVPISELALRCEKLIFNKIANDQLQNQVQQATELAFIAMSDSSDLGINIQFLLEAHECSNLDELGMRLLQAVSSYGLRASLQLRSNQGIKNMELSGMAKDLESTLMWELHNAGRYVDFGRRSVMNYESISLLVKNMPLEDDKKYGAIKDNVFSLLQGAHARLEALDTLHQVKQQQVFVSQLARRMNKMMGEIDNGYQEVMKHIADVVENMSDGIHQVITNLALHEDQEQALEKVIEYGMNSTNVIFTRGLKLDESFHHMVEDLEELFGSDSEKLTDAQKVKLKAILEGGLTQ